MKEVQLHNSNGKLKVYGLDGNGGSDTNIAVVHFTLTNPEDVMDNYDPVYGVDMSVEDIYDLVVDGAVVLGFDGGETEVKTVYTAVKASDLSSFDWLQITKEVLFVSCSNALNGSFYAYRCTGTTDGTDVVTFESSNSGDSDPGYDVTVYMASSYDGDADRHYYSCDTTMEDLDGKTKAKLVLTDEYGDETEHIGIVAPGVNPDGDNIVAIMIPLRYSVTLGSSNGMLERYYDTYYVDENGDWSKWSPDISFTSTIMGQHAAQDEEEAL